MKKFACILMCIAALVPVFGILSYAIPSEIYYDSAEMLCFPEDEIIIPDRSNEAKKFFSNINCTYKFYNNLTEPQKAAYNSLIEQQAGLNNEGTATLVFPKTSESISLTIQAALCAAIDDYPEYFWIGSYSATYQTVGSNCYFTLTFSYDTSSYPTWNDLKNAYDTLMEKVAEVKVTGTSRYEKVKCIHDYICNITTYQSGAMAHQPTGVFINGKAVCEGYAEAFKLLCDRENIPCIIVVGLGDGGAHEWNYVQMEDGNWYGMDVTWDDQDSRIDYSYFLVGSETVTRFSNYTGTAWNFGNGTDTEGNHINAGTHFENSTYALTYPTLVNNSYTGIMLSWNSSATYDNEKGFMYISKDAVAEEQILCTWPGWYINAPYTDVATVTGLTTGGQVSITSPVTKNYTIIRHGDVNKDNSVNETDYNNVRDIAICRQSSYTDSAQFAAADMNGDGVIDTFDAIALDIYYNS